MLEKVERYFRERKPNFRYLLYLISIASQLKYKQKHLKTQ